MDAPPAAPDLLDAAVEVARAAGEQTLRWFRTPDLEVMGKSDGTPVTAADRAAETEARRLIGQRFPSDAVVGEEHDDVAGTSGRTWFVDPIDGTQGFARGVPLYSTLVAVDDEHGPLVGVIHMPALGLTVSAGRGLGCFEDDERCQVSGRTELRGAYVMTSGTEQWAADTLRRLLGAGVRLRTWGDGYGYALVAAGRVDAMIDPSAAVWDLAPMPVILAEAGGRFSDWSGSERADGGSGLATNGALHDELLALLSG